MPSNPTHVEEFEVTGEKLLSAVKRLVHEGNIRRISIRNASGVTLLEIPLVVGLAGAVFIPVWAAVGALAALVAHCTLVIERSAEESPTPKPPKARTAGTKPPKSTTGARTRAA
jgi:hypothetical protein